MGIQSFGPAKVTNRATVFTGTTNKRLGNTAGWYQISRAGWNGNSQDTYGSLYVNGGLIVGTSTPDAPRMLNLPANASVDYYPDMITGAVTPASSNFNYGAYGNGLYMLETTNFATNYNRIYISTDSSTWYSNKPNNLTIDYSGATAYGNGYYVAVGSSGAVRASTDLITWVTRTSGTTMSLYALTYANGLFVAGTNTSTAVLTSPDSITWTQRGVTSGATSVPPVYGANGWLLGGQSLRIINYSNDGISWGATSDTNFSTSWGINSTTYGNGVYLIGASINGMVRRTTNIQSAAAWTSPDVKLGSTYGISCVLYCGGSTFLATNSGYGLSSSTDNGVTWALRTTPGTQSLYTYANGYIYGINSPQGATISSGTVSTDSITWTVRADAPATILKPAASGYYGINPNLNNSAIITSTNGTSWASIGPINPSSTGYAMVFGNGLFVSSSGSTIDTSTDGMIWTIRKSTAGTVYSFIYNNNKFYIGDSQSNISISTDGLSWSQYALGIGIISGIAASPSIAVAVSSTTHTLSTSTDSISWTTRTAPTSGLTASYLNGIAYGNGVFSAISSTGGYAFTSTDGITWTANTIAISPSRSRNCIFFLGSRFIIPGTVGGVYSSGNGASWALINTGQTSTSLNAPIYANDSLKVYGASSVYAYDNPTPNPAYLFTSDYGPATTLV